MGLFENLGRKVEQFKQDATDSAEKPTHTCQECGDDLYADYEECPDCGGTVVAIDHESETASGDAEPESLSTEEEGETAPGDVESD